VFLVSPALKQACPKSAACWSPAIPAMGMPAPSFPIFMVRPNMPDDGFTAGDVVRYLRAHPEVAAQNATVRQKEIHEL